MKLKKLLLTGVSAFRKVELSAEYYSPKSVGHPTVTFSNHYWGKNNWYNLGPV